MYPRDPTSRIRGLHTVRIYACRSFFLILFLPSLHIRDPLRDIWTKIDNGTKPSFGIGRSPKRIGPNTRLNRGMANIAGFGPPILCAWNNTGADCEPPKHNALKRCRPRRLFDDWEGLQ
jgi:hypothetical protein